VFLLGNMRSSAVNHSRSVELHEDRCRLADRLSSSAAEHSSVGLKDFSARKWRSSWSPCRPKSSAGRSQTTQSHQLCGVVTVVQNEGHVKFLQCSYVGGHKLSVLGAELFHLPRKRSTASVARQIEQCRIASTRTRKQVGFGLFWPGAMRSRLVFPRIRATTLFLHT